MDGHPLVHELRHLRFERRVDSPISGLVTGRARAGTRDYRASERGRPRREITIDAGRRVRARRDASHSRRQARRTVNEAGDRHWPVESPTRGRQAGASEAAHDFSAHASTGCARDGECAQRRSAEGFQKTGDRGAARPEKRRALSGVTPRARASGTLDRAETRFGSTIRLGEEGGTDPGAGSLNCN